MLQVSGHSCCQLVILGTLQVMQDAGDAVAVTARQLPAHDARLHCVDLADQFAAAGAKSGAVQTFDFSGAAAAAERSQVGKLACQARSSIAGGLLRPDTGFATNRRASCSHVVANC